MAWCASRVIAFICVLSTFTWADDRVYFASENERRWNTPPKLTPEPIGGKLDLDNESPQPRFLPFSASFSLSAGGNANNAHSLSVGGSQDGISFSQSASQAGSSFGNEGVGGSQDGISFSQSASQVGSSFGNEGSGISASQSSSFSAGLSGISAADANSFNLNHPTFGGNSQANSNSFASGQATSSAQGNVINGQGTSGAQSGVGSSHSSASSGASSSTGVGSTQGQSHRQSRPTWTNIAPNYEVGGLYNPNGGRPKHINQGPPQKPLRLDVSVDDNWQQRRPEVSITEYRPISGNRGHRQGQQIHTGHFQSSATSSSNTHQNWDSNQGSSGDRQSWTQSPLTGPQPGSWSHSQNNKKPGLQISGASASSSATSNSPGGSSFGQSSSLSSLGQNGPTSWTNNNVQTSGNAQSQAQGSAAAVGQNFQGSTQGSFSSGAIAGGSHGNGFSHGNSASGNRGGNSRGQVTNHATGTAFVQGTANAGSVSFVKFPGEETPQNIPKEFVRSQPSPNVRNGQRRKNSRSRDPVGEIISDFTDSVAELFDI